MRGFLSPKTLLELDLLFQKKDWKIDDEYDVKKSLYKRYCDRLKHLDEDEQTFFIDLSYRFEQIGIADYIEFLLMSLHKIEDEKLKKVEKIIFSPLTKPYIWNDSGDKKVEKPKTKSAEFLFYLLNVDDIRWVEYSSKFEFLESINNVKENFICDKTLLILIDDFVGTGDTAVKCVKNIIEEIQEVKTINSSDVCIISIAALEQGIKFVNDEIGIKIYSNIIRTKGISDYYSPDLKNDKIDSMLRIEKKLGCPKNFSLGHGKSEALITFMNKTPNNTFPAYWHETETKIAPFPRYKNYK